MRLVIDTEQLMHELETLATFSDAPPPAVTRVVFSETDCRAREFVKGLCQAAGLVLREDAVGNTFARWVGHDTDLPAIGTGSHIDAIPYSGRYDGTVGVLGGLAAIRALQHSALRPRRSIELVIFTSEEPTLFGIGCLGSRFLAGNLDATRRDVVLAEIEDACEQVAARRGVTVRKEIVNADAPVKCAPKVVEALSRACTSHGFGFQLMVSRAYHDSLFLSRIVPTAMLFIPCRGGISHRPDEYASRAAIGCGALVLAEALAGLAM